MDANPHSCEFVVRVPRARRYVKCQHALTSCHDIKGLFPPHFPAGTVGHATGQGLLARARVLRVRFQGCGDMAYISQVVEGGASRADRATARAHPRTRSTPGPRIATTPASRPPRTHRFGNHRRARSANRAGASREVKRVAAALPAAWSRTLTSVSSSR